MAYTTTELAKQAMSLLNPLLDGIKVNNLDNYISGQMRRDFITDRGTIQGALDEATSKAYDVERAQALQDAANAETTNYRNTKSAISELRRNLVGAGSFGANVGAANASALQALLGLGQQNTDTTTEGLRAVNNVSRERAAAMAKNAVDAITQANDATAKMYDAGTSAYASDRSYAAQGAAEAVGQLAGAADTNASQERMTAETNAAQERMNERTAQATENAAKSGANQTVTTVDGGKKKSTKKKKK